MYKICKENNQTKWYAKNGMIKNMKQKKQN
jgi:hypothetical protein